MTRIRRAVLVAIAFWLATPLAAEDEWVRLGMRHVTDRAEIDTMEVTGAKGIFRRIKLRVDGTTVRFYKVVVTFGNGERQEIEMRDQVHPGGETRAIDLRGADRIIRKVDFLYEAASLGGRGAVVQLLGRR
jgi:hypothetical protein